MIRKWTDEQVEFQVWLATPKSERGTKTQAKLAKELGTTPVTLSRWKRLPGFIEASDGYRRRSLSPERLNNIIDAQYEKATIDKDTPAAKLLLTWAGELTTRIDVTSDDQPIGIQTIEVIKDYGPPEDD